MSLSSARDERVKNRDKTIIDSTSLEVSKIFVKLERKFSHRADFRSNILSRHDNEEYNINLQ